MVLPTTRSETAFSSPANNGQRFLKSRSCLVLPQATADQKSKPGVEKLGGNRRVPHVRPSVRGRSPTIALAANPYPLSQDQKFKTHHGSEGGAYLARFSREVGYPGAQLTVFRA